MMQPTAPQAAPGDGFSHVACLEARLVAILGRTAKEVDHTECFDQEQRAEVYAILQALKSDTDVHRAMVDLLARQLSGKTGHA